MNLIKVFDRTAFNNAIVKLILNVPAIENIIHDFSGKSFEEWEERVCEHCSDDRLCKKHRSLERVMDAEKAVKITGIGMPDGLDGLYVSKSDMFVFNRDVGSALIIDCPPLFSNGRCVNDSWIRRIIPFTFGRFGKENTLEVVQEIDLNKIFEFRTLSCSFGRIDAEQKQSLVLHNNYGVYHWELES